MQGEGSEFPGSCQGCRVTRSIFVDLGPQFYSNGSKSVRTLCLVTKNYTDHQHSYKPAGWFMSTKENRDPPVLPVAVSFQWFRLFEKTSGKTLFSLWKSTSLERNPPFWCNPKLPQAHPDTLIRTSQKLWGFQGGHSIPCHHRDSVASLLLQNQWLGCGFHTSAQKNGENKWNVTSWPKKKLKII